MAEEKKEKEEKKTKDNTPEEGKNKAEDDEPKSIDEGKINVSIEPDEPKNFSLTLGDIRDKATNLSRMSEQGIVNEVTGSAMVVRTDGQINLTSSKFSAIRMNPQGKIIDQSLESETIANRKKFTVDEITINEHKLNPQLWELADMRHQKLLINQNVTIGNLTIDGHVLVKAWEPNLKRYMLIRRPWRGPMFGPLLNVPEIHTALGINDPLKLNEDILALSDKGYQVNGAIRDAKSLIGKDGVDREGGVNRNTDAMNTGGGPGGKAPTGGLPDVKASADAESIFKALKKLGYNDVAAAGIMGNAQQESSMDPTSSGAYACGLFQWGNGCDGGRWQKLLQNYPEPSCWEAGNQLAFMYYECQTGYTNCLPDTLNGFSTPEEAAEHFEVNYEGAGEPMMENRKSYARQFYDLYKGK